MGCSVAESASRGAIPLTILLISDSKLLEEGELIKSSNFPSKHTEGVRQEGNPPYNFGFSLLFLAHHLCISFTVPETKANKFQSDTSVLNK